MAAMYGLSGAAGQDPSAAGYDYSAYYAMYGNYYGYGAGADGAQMDPAAVAAAAAAATGAQPAATDGAAAAAADPSTAGYAAGNHWYSPMYPGYRFSYTTQQWEPIPPGEVQPPAPTSDATQAAAADQQQQQEQQ